VWCLRGPGPGVARLWVAALLEAGTPEVNVTGGPVVAVGGVLANDDPKAGLLGRRRASNLGAPRTAVRVICAVPGEVERIGGVNEGAIAAGGRSELLLAAAAGGLTATVGAARHSAALEPWAPRRGPTSARGRLIAERVAASGGGGGNQKP